MKFIKYNDKYKIRKLYMDFLNKIGQRNIAKYLVGASVGSSLLIFLLKHFGIGVSGVRPGFLLITIGTLIFTLPNILLSLAAHKSREHRLMAIFSSSVVFGLNTILFALSLVSPPLSLFLFIVALIEIIGSGAFYGYAIKSENKRQQQKSRRKTKEINEDSEVDKTNLTDKEKEENE